MNNKKKQTKSDIILSLNDRIEYNVKNKELTYLESIVESCKELDLDLEGINKYVSKQVKQKLFLECSDLNLLKITRKKKQGF